MVMECHIHIKPKDSHKEYH